MRVCMRLDNVCSGRALILRVHPSPCVVFRCAPTFVRESCPSARPPPSPPHNTATTTSTRFSGSGGGSTDASCVYQCNAKADAAAWAAVGCVVSGAATGTKRSDLGDGTAFRRVAGPPNTYPF